MSASVLDCADVRSGNGRTAGRLEMPGLVAWVHSVPSGSAEGGGDVHYVSVCPSCIVSHVALADVSGHGQAVGRSARNSVSSWSATFPIWSRRGSCAT